MSTRQRSLRRRRLVGGVVVLLLVAVGAIAGLDAWRAHAAGDRALAAFQFVENNTPLASTHAGRVTLEAHLRTGDQNSALAQRDLQSGFVLSALRVVPYLGNEVTGALRELGDARTVALVGQQLLAAVDANAATTTSLSSTHLHALQVALTNARTALLPLDRPVGTLFGPVGNDRALLDRKLQRLTWVLQDASSGITVTESLLGTTTPATVLVLPENNAEMRDQGSILEYSLLRIGDGHLQLLRSGSVGGLGLSAPLPVPSSPGINKYFVGDESTTLFQDVDAPANYAWIGATAAAMFQRSTGIHVDDVVSLDVPAMAALLNVTGPLTVPGISQTLTAANFSTVVLHDLYQEFPAGSQTIRKNYLNEIAADLLARLSSPDASPLTLLEALAHEVPGRHLLLWSATPSVEAAITRLGAGGQIDLVDPASTFHVAVESVVAAKLDYYVRVHDDYTVTPDPHGGATVTLRVTVINTAPAGQAPSYQLGPDDNYAHVSGEYVANVFVWEPRGARALGLVPDAGLALTGQSLVVDAQHQASLTFTTFLPHAVRHGVLLLHLVPQPTLVPAVATLRVQGPNGRFTPVRRSVSLDAPVTWRVAVANV